MKKPYKPKHSLVPAGIEMAEMPEEDRMFWMRFVFSNSYKYEDTQKLHDKLMDISYNTDPSEFLNSPFFRRQIPNKIKARKKTKKRE